MDAEARIDRYLAAHPEAPRALVLPSRLLFHVAYMLEDAVAEALAPFELSMQAYLALAYLSADREGLQRPSQLSRSLGATRTQVTRLIDGLASRGLVLRRVSADDRRGIDLAPTRAGTALLARATPVVHAVYGRVWGGLPARQLAALTDGLRHAGDALERGAA